MLSGSPRIFIFAIPGDIHLIGKLRLIHADDFKAYFNEAESLAKKILKADEFYMQRGRRPVRPEALDRMKRIAYVIRGACKAGRKALKKKNETDAQVCADRILHLRAEIFSEPDRSRGELQIKNLSKGGKAKAYTYEKKHATWQSRADEIWRERPNATISVVARRIKKETGDKFETIRRVIRKSPKGNLKRIPQA